MEKYYSKQFGKILADLLEDLDLSEATGINLNEIRNPEKLQAALNDLEASDEPVPAEVINRLKYLRGKKIDTEKRKEDQRESTARKQHKIATGFGYTKVGKGHYIHKGSGHVLRFDGNNSWTHTSPKRPKKGETPLNALKRHLRGIHEEVENIQEIRGLEGLRSQLNNLRLKPVNPLVQNKIERLQALERRKTQLGQPVQKPIRPHRIVPMNPGLLTPSQSPMTFGENEEEKLDQNQERGLKTGQHTQKKQQSTLFPNSDKMKKMNETEDNLCSNCDSKLSKNDQCPYCDALCGQCGKDREHCVCDEFTD